MVVVRSVSTCTSRFPGRVDCSCGSSALIRSTTSITLAPGWRWMFSTTAGRLLAQAARRTFSASSSTLATSRMRSGEPFL